MEAVVFFGGNRFDVSNPERYNHDKDFTFAVEALYRIRRGGGRLDHALTVGEHSCLVFLLVLDALNPRTPFSSDIKQYLKAALLHDLHEAFIGDVVTPLKPFLGEPWKNLEESWERRMASVYGYTEEHLNFIKPFDKMAWEMELTQEESGGLFCPDWESRRKDQFNMSNFYRFFQLCK